MNSIKKFISSAAALALCMGIGISASAFSDMPSGATGEALQAAVDAGLINGITDDTIVPEGNLTRAQMATILVRAFGANTDSDKTFNDVKSTDWYADAVSKAVAMGAFEGDDDNNFNPENNITFQETYIVLSRMFGFEPYEVKYSTKPSVMVSDVDSSVLNSFSDAAELADWAKSYASYIVGNGGWTGINGQLKPTSYITRGEFAEIMHTIVTTYVDAPGDYNSLPDGLTMVRCGGVNIDGFKTDKNLILTYGVDEKGVNVTNSTVNGVTLILGGVDKTPTAEASGKVLPDESYISLAGTYYDVRVKTPYVYLNGSAAKISFYNGTEGSLVGLSLQ